ncbi:alpha/beta-hydrolase family protein [Actinomycetospora cinnamomea]|uniref:Putative membrane protein n=1 Tax=Actinomycetospora cinnamomea TaxID=663609 RepID=A0A2U1FPY8_9PSEU|nr:alpha/beta-hydrolase family protein [Actinomycetospora cinnamomea]PVZ14172.1 putative membrane protein [Actinomycetospora cinnamomea]
MTTPGRRRWWDVDPAGFAVATVLAVVALTPSLIPRTGLVQGVVSGVAAALGYAGGVAVAWLLRRRAVRARARALVPARLARPGQEVASPVHRALAVAIPVVLVVAVVVAAHAQQRAAALVGTTPPTTTSFLLALPVMVLVPAVLVVLVRAARGLTARLARLMRRRVHLSRAAAVLGAVLLVLLVTAVADGAAARAAVVLAEHAFAARNDQPGTAAGPPTRATRSGSPASLVPWDTLGREGRRFVVGGRPAEQLALAGARRPVDPIRVYVGLESAPDPRQRAALAVAELERTGAFDRAVLALVTPTGTGSVDPPIPDSLELVHGGDTAMAALQYSYLPSALSFFLDLARAEETSRLLLGAVRARLDQLPPDRRPRLLVFGQSLGAQASQSVFDSIDDARARSDGVLWVGPPHASRLWQAQLARRAPTSPAVDPVVGGGREVRFAARPGEVAASPPSPWDPPRVLYLQHPSDPVVWWSPTLLWGRPDWLAEPPGDDRPAAMRWFPVVTFWQVTVDLPRAQTVPSGHGHRYGDLLVDAWAAVAPPPVWTADDTARARRVLVG